MMLPDWESMRGAPVVVDVAAAVVYVGVLSAVNETFVELDDADVHELEPGSMGKALFIMETARHGIRPTRERVRVRLACILSISRLDEIRQYG